MAVPSSMWLINLVIITTPAIISAMCGSIQPPGGSPIKLAPVSLMKTMPFSSLTKIHERRLPNHLFCTLPESCNGDECNNELDVIKLKCNCPTGRVGPQCQYDFNECESNPCFHNGTCRNLDNRYNCSCIAGTTGDNCEIEINECDSSPCLNGATCLDRLNAFECWCFPGYIGVICDTESSIVLLLKQKFILAGSLAPESSILDTPFTRLSLPNMTSMESAAYDPQDKWVFWSHTTKYISRATLNGSAGEIITSVSEGRQVRDIALDFVDRKIYWTTLNSVERANFDGSASEILIMGPVYSEGIAVDSLNRKLFFREQWEVNRIDFEEGFNPIELARSITSPSGRIFYYQEETRVLFEDVARTIVRSVRSDGTDLHDVFHWNSSTYVRFITAHNGILNLVTNREFVEVPLSNSTPSSVRVEKKVRAIDRDYNLIGIEDLYVYHLN